MISLNFSPVDDGGRDSMLITDVERKSLSIWEDKDWTTSFTEDVMNDISPNGIHVAT